MAIIVNDHVIKTYYVDDNMIKISVDWKTLNVEAVANWCADTISCERYGFAHMHGIDTGKLVYALFTIGGYIAFSREEDALRFALKWK